MSYLDRIYSSLDAWGDYPVATEIQPGMDEISLSADDFRRRIGLMADQLRKFGVRRRSPVPLFLENTLEFPIIFFALIEIGALPVMVKLDYRSLELNEIFLNLKPDIVISEKSHIRVIAPWLSGKTVIQRCDRNLELIQTSEQRPEEAQVAPEAVSINYTYRGYGYPLGAITDGSLYTFGAGIIKDGLQSRPGAPMLVILPMSHIWTLVGCITLPILQKSTALICRTLNPRVLFNVIENHKVEYIHAIPELLSLLHRTRPESKVFKSWHTAITGGSLMTPDQWQAYTRDLDITVLHGYGLTESTPVSRNYPGNTRPGTIGPVSEGLEYRFADDGEILIDPPYPIHGYYRNTNVSKEALDGKWFRTGDFGHMDEGHLIFDREKKRTRKLNGNIVDLLEVEQAILSDPSVSETQIKYESGRLTAYIGFEGCRDDASVLAKQEALKKYLVAIMARYKVPRLIAGIPD